MRSGASSKGWFGRQFQRLWFLPWTVFAVVSAISIAVAVALHELNERQQQAQFEHLASDHTRRFENQARLAFRPTMHMAAIFNYQAGRVTQANFNALLETIPGLLQPYLVTLQWLPRTITNGRVSFPFRYSFYPNGDPAALEPDLLAIPAQRSALALAARQQHLTPSPWYLESGQVRFRVYRAVFDGQLPNSEDRLVGFVSGTYAVVPLVEDSLAAIPGGDVELIIQDAKSSLPGYIHYTADGDARYVSAPEPPLPGTRRFSDTANLFGSSWQITALAAPGAFIASPWPALLMLSGGLLLGGVLSLYLHTLLMREIQVGRQVQHRTEQLSRSEARHRLLVETLPSGIIELDDQGVIRYVNAAFCRTFSYGLEELLTKPFRDLFIEDEKLSMQSQVQAIATGEFKECKGDHRLLNGMGEERLVTLECAPIGFQRGQYGELLVVTDVTEQRQANEQLQLAGTVFKASNEAIMVTDAQNNIISVNPAFTRITGYTLEEVKGKNPKVLQSGHQSPEFYQQLWNNLQRNGCWEGEIVNRRKDGALYVEWISIVKVKDGALHYVALFNDITRHKEAEEMIRWQAHYDPVTGLPNRILFKEQLEHALGNARRNHSKLALLFIDLDQFKYVNDTLGHTAGDELLCQTAQRLKQSVRSSDTVARLGGDEFTVLMENLTHDEDPARGAQTILEKLSKPFLLGVTEAFVSASIGITEFPGDSDKADQLLVNADTAMYQAKAQGRNTFRFFMPQMNAIAARRLTLGRNLHRALERQELEIFYQPIVDANRHCTRCVEALLRWRLPDGSLSLPDSFIPFAEELGLIIPIGKWVMQQVCDQHKSWKQNALNMPIAINLSVRQCVEKDGPQQLINIIQNSGIDPEALILEITESVVLDAEQKGKRALHEFKSAGVSLAMDDFGTGYSSLSYFKDLPIDIVKLDQGFVHDLPQNSRSAVMVQAILNMSHALGRPVIAEGVELAEQARFLNENGCDFQQGYCYARAMPVDELENWLRRAATDNPWQLCAENSVAMPLDA